MSAICGLYDQNGDITAEDAKAVLTELGKYKFDKTGSFQKGPVFLGCHLNFVSPESLHETLPYEDGKSALVITADAVIYNREELFHLLDNTNADQTMPDSRLILEAYKKWGLQCPEKLVGDFAFAIWDRRKDTVFCARDHTGNRTFYYYYTPELFAFSTLIEPLFRIKAIKRTLNDAYIADFLSIASVLPELGDEPTVYETIFNLPPASAMLIGKDGLKKWRYWEIKTTPTIRYATDAEYEAAFREIYSEAVRCRLRSVKKVGISLSGGLDSGSVACLAAPELKKYGKKLYSFTQVPIAEYKNWLPENRLADERSYVEEICAFTGNIEPHAVISEGRSPLTEIDSMMDILERPYKNIGNTYWMNALRQDAADMDIGVLLNGQVGNATVSWGVFDFYMVYLIRSLHLRTLCKEIRAHSAITGISSKQLLMKALHYLLPYSLKKYLHLKRGGKDMGTFLPFINPALFREMKIDKRLRKYGEPPPTLASGNSSAYRAMLLGFPRFSNNGSASTKMSLAFRLEMRDPTKDKRLIEFCFRLPENQWVRNGEERRFIRHAMAGYIPDKVRLNTTVRGKQAADWMQRITPEAWAAVYQEMATIGEGALERKYFDIPKIKRLLAQNKTLSPDDHSGMKSGVVTLLRALVFTRFLRNME